MAFRVALSLAVVLLLAPPASAQFSTEDLNGRWIVHATRVGVTQAGEAGWLQGFVHFLRSGAVTDDEVRDQGETLVPLRPGALTVSASGEVLGVLGNASVQARFADMNQIVGVATGDAGAPDETNTFFVLIREPTGEFSQADATGTWRLTTLLVPTPPATTSEYVFGQIVIGDDGAITGGQLTSSNGSMTAFAGGGLFVNPDGTFGGQLEIGPLGNDYTSFSGTFAPGRGLMVGAASRFLSDEQRNGMFVLQREPTAVYAPGDAAGTWEFFSVQALSGDSVGAWLRGTLIADKFGVVTGGTLTDGFGDSFPVSQGFISISGEGFVVAEILFGSDLIIIQGSMVPNKTQVFGVDIFAGEVWPRLGFSTLVKAGPAGPPPAIVQFSQPTYTVTEGAAKAVVTAVRTGTRTIPFTVAYTASPVTAVPDQDFSPVSGTLTFASGTLSRTFHVPISNDSLVDGSRSVALALGTPVGNATLGPLATALLTIRDNDQPGRIKLGSASYSVNEGAGSLLVTILRTGTNLAGNVSVSYATGNASAQAGLDYTATVDTLTFNATETSRTVRIPILNDTLVEGPETFTFTLSNPTNGASLLGAATATMTIVDDESAIQFSASDYVGKEGTPAVVTISRSGARTTPATVTFTATPGTATPGLDFTPVSRLVTFAAGQASKTVNVPILDNRLVQGNRTVMLGLDGPTGSAQLGTRAGAVLTIAEDDQGGVIRLSAPTYAVSEGAGSVLVKVLRSGVNLAGNVSIDFTTFDVTARSDTDGDDDYERRSGTLTFNAGETSKVITIPIFRDTVVEADETFKVVLRNPTGGARFASLDPPEAVVTIKDDDVSSRIKLSASSYRVVEGAGNASIMVVRSAALFREVTIHYSTSPTGTNPATPDASEAPDADYGAVEGDITFLPNQTTAFITVPIFQDPAAEGNETFLITLGEPGPGATVVSPSSATVTILDDESVVQFSLKFIGNMPEVVRTGPTNTQVTVDFFSEDGTATAGTDYAPVSGTLTFKVGQSSAFIPLLIRPDILAEGPETFTMSLANPLPEGSASLGPLSSQTWAITDNDFGGTVQFGVANLTASPGESKKIPIVRTGGGGSILTVNWRAISGTTSEAFSPTSGSVTFGANETTKSFTIDVEDFEPTGADLTAVFALGVAPGAANIGARNTSTLTIFGSRADVNLPLSVYSVVEGGGPAVVSVTRDGNVDRQVSVAYATSDGTALAGRDYTATSGRLTFVPGQQMATFTVPILDNGPSGQTGFLNLTLSNPSPATAIGEGSNARLQIREAPVFNYRLIADTTEAISGFGGVPSINDNGTVAFKAFMTDEDVRVLRANASALTTIASVVAQDLLGIDGSRFPIDAAGNVVFLATAGNERRTIFRGSGGGLTPLLQTNEAYTDLFDPSVSPNGNVAFGAAQAEGGLAIFTGPGAEGVSLFVAGGDEVFQEVGGFPGVNDDGAVAFVGARNDEGARGIFVANPNDGGLPTVATGVTTDTFATISLNGAGQVSFTSTLPAPDGPAILIGRNGSATTTFVSAANGFQFFGQPEEDSSPVINALGNVAYLARTLETSGILTGPGPDTDMVIREGDPLLGSNVAFLRFGGFNAAGQIAFRAGLLDGREAIVVGTPPAASGSAALSITAIPNP